MEFSWDASRAAFAEATAWFVTLTAGCEGVQDAPGLGVWTVRDLVGHTSRALLTVETYLARPAPVEVASAVDYYLATGAAAGDDDVAERGRQAGRDLGSDIPAAVAAIAARVVPLARGSDPDAALTTAAGGMRLRDYLPTRTVELVVHTCDLAVALGREPDLPATAAREAGAVLTALAAARGVAGPALLALTGRRGLPPGFSVLSAAGARP